jgi:transposase
MRSRAYARKNVNQVNVESELAGRGDQEAVVGIDVSKKELVLVLRWRDGRVSRPWSAKNPHQLPELMDLLQRLGVGRKLTVGLEPTGTYGDPLRQALSRARLFTVQISPKASHDYAEIYDGTPSQHDGKDAAIVAELCAMGKYTPWPWHSPSAWDELLQQHVQEMDHQSRIFRIWCGQLEALLARHWPEALGLLKCSSSTLMQVLIRYGCPAALAADPDGLMWLHRWGGAGLKPEKAQALLDSAGASFGVSVSPVQQQRLKELAGRALAARRGHDAAANQLRKLAAGHRGIQVMASAVGLPTACVVWSCVGDPMNYAVSAAWVKAMGLNLAERSSGRYHGKLKISKRGPRMVRQWLYMAALRLVRDHEVVRRWYKKTKVVHEQRKDLEHKTASRVALVAVMRRLAQALHHVSVSGEEFDVRRLFPGAGRALARSAARC